MATSKEEVRKPRKRTVHQLDTPYSSTNWPEVSAEDQDTILELLCNFLAPLGQHRQLHVTASKGKKATRRRKTQEAAESMPAPPPPELARSVDIGFNSITRNLAPESPQREGADGPRKSYSMVFVTRGDQTSAFNCHFPRMIGAASSQMPQASRTRLVGFSKSCSERLSKSLGVTRVSSIAVSHQAPGAGALWEEVRRVVAPIQDGGWLEDRGHLRYHATKINAIETTVGAKRAKSS